MPYYTRFIIPAPAARPVRVSPINRCNGMLYNRSIGYHPAAQTIHHQVRPMNQPMFPPVRQPLFSRPTNANSYYAMPITVQSWRSSPLDPHFISYRRMPIYAANTLSVRQSPLLQNQTRVISRRVISSRIISSGQILASSMAPLATAPPVIERRSLRLGSVDAYEALSVSDLPPKEQPRFVEVCADYFQKINNRAMTNKNLMAHSPYPSSSLDHHQEELTPAQQKIFEQLQIDPTDLDEYLQAYNRPLTQDERHQIIQEDMHSKKQLSKSLDRWRQEGMPFHGDTEQAKSAREAASRANKVTSSEFRGC